MHQKQKKKKSKTKKHCLKIQNFRRNKRRKFTQTIWKKKSGILKENSIQNFETRMLIATLLIARNLPYNQIGQAYGARDPWRGSLFGSRILYPTSAIASAKTHRGVDTHKVLGIYIYTDPYYTFHDQHLSKLVNNFKKKSKAKKKIHVELAITITIGFQILLTEGGLKWKEKERIVGFGCFSKLL